MRNARSKKRTQEASPYARQGVLQTASRINIRFDLSRQNLKCFIGQKRQIKKTVPKRSQSKQLRKPSQKKKPQTVQKDNEVSQKSRDQRKVGESPDIIRQSSNCILSKIEEKGIKYEWVQTGTSEDENGQVEQLNENLQIWSVFSMDQSLLKQSYASTMDYQQPNYQPNYYHSAEYNAQNYAYQAKQIQTCYDPNFGFQIRIDQIGFDPRTTIMIRNIPNKYTIKDLSSEIDRYFENTYDFLYLPCDFKNNCNVGYGFINFVNTSYLRDFYLDFHNRGWGKFKSEKICSLTYARLQGLNSLIDHFINSKVLNSKQTKYRPIIKTTAKINSLIRAQQQQ